MTADARARTARLRLTLDVTVDLEGWRAYCDREGGNPENPGDTLLREAATALEWSGLGINVTSRDFEVLPDA